MRSTRSMFLAAGAMILASCSGADQQAEEHLEESDAPSMQIVACTDLCVSNARVVRPAVSGNPAVAYFELSNQSGNDTVLTGASAIGASSVMIHGYADHDGMTSMVQQTEIPLGQGQTLSFAPGGLHIMVFGIDGSSRDGRSVEITLDFADGASTSFTAPVVDPGEER